jgi:hypothetical protein
VDVSGLYGQSVSHSPRQCAQSAGGNISHRSPPRSSEELRAPDAGPSFPPKQHNTTYIGQQLPVASCNTQQTAAASCPLQHTTDSSCQLPPSLDFELPWPKKQGLWLRLDLMAAARFALQWREGTSGARKATSTRTIANNAQCFKPCLHQSPIGGQGRDVMLSEPQTAANQVASSSRGAAR